MTDDGTWVFGIAFLILVWWLGRSTRSPFYPVGTSIAYPAGTSGQLNPFFDQSLGRCG